MIPASNILTGERFATDDSAQPAFDRTEAPIRRIELLGTIDGLSLNGFYLACRRARIDPNVQTVLISIDCRQSVWDVRDGAAAIHRIARDGKRTIAFVDNALGSSFELALSCAWVFASAVAKIGCFAAFTSGDLCEAESHSRATINGMAALRRGVPVHRWSGLLDSSIHGELAETFGIVDDLANSVDDLIEKLSLQEQRQ